jgi:hypothetical protein
MADVVILAENTSEIAMGEEDGARPVIANQRRLLAKVRKSTGHHKLRWGLAVSNLSIQSVHPTLSRAEPALL